MYNSKRLLACGMGVWALLAVLAATPAARAQTFSIIHSFAGWPSDGANPEAGVVADSAGDLYGVTPNGGAFGFGTVFELVNSSGTYTEKVLFNFPGGGHGSFPSSGIALDASGDVYGSSMGGELLCNGGGAVPCGLIFKVDTTGKETLLHVFGDEPLNDGVFPSGDLLRDSAGNLFGTTIGGGAGFNAFCAEAFNGCGTVFEVTAGGEKVLHSFSGPGDGLFPNGGVIVGSGNTLYGTTTSGGAQNQGTVFKLDPATGEEALLYSFTGGADGGDPNGRLLQDDAGNLYGTTITGGGSSSNCDGFGCGTVFKLDPSGVETVLHTFVGGKTDGAFPYAGLVRDAAGNLYGTTREGGSTVTTCGIALGCGTVFKLDPTGKETVLHRVFGGRSGEGPICDLIVDSAGNLYGTVAEGGPNSAGFVFKLAP